MTPRPVEPGAWSPSRWMVAIVVVFGLQALLIFWFGDTTPPHPRHPKAGPVFRLSGHRSREWLALEDPTLFALPHLEGFSGKAWIDLHPPEFPETDIQEPEKFLSLPVSRLGKAFEEFTATNPPPAFITLAELEPELVAPRTALALPASGPSRLRIGGELEGRALLNPPALPSWTNSDLLTNTVVQLVVDSPGNVLSAVLLPPGSGYEPANQFAINLGRNARFAPKPASERNSYGRASGLAVGTLVFEWQTVLVPATNAAAAIP